MSKESKKNYNSRSKYFKWGFTAFCVIMASVLSIYTILNLSVLSNALSNFMKTIMPIIDGLVVAYILSPMVDKIEDHILFPLIEKRKIEITEKREKIIRFIAVLISLCIVILLILLFIKSVVPQLIESLKNIYYKRNDYLDSLINIANQIIVSLDLFKEKDIVSIIEHYYEDIMEFVQLNLVPRLNDWVRSLSNSVFTFLGALFDLLIGFFIAIYLLLSKEKFRAQFKKLIYSFFETKRANLVIQDIRYIDKTFTSFIGGKIVDSIIIGLLCFIIITIFNIPYTILISVIVGVTNIIPFFGPFIGAIPSAILILLIDPVKAIYFVIIAIILQQIDGNFIGPMILGNSTGLSGFWVIFSITLFGGIWGVPGMFLGVPTFACIYAGIRRKMITSLEKKNLSQNTADYIDLDRIKDHKYIKKESMKQTDSKENVKSYTILSETKKENVAKQILQNNIIKTKDYLSNKFTKESIDESDVNSDEEKEFNLLDQINENSSDE